LHQNKKRRGKRKRGKAGKRKGSRGKSFRVGAKLAQIQKKRESAGQEAGQTWDGGA